MTIQKYLLSSVARRPEGEGQGEPPAAPTQDNRSEGEKAFSFDPGEFFVPPAKEASGAGEGDEGKAPAEPSKDPAATGAASTAGAGSTPSSPKPEPAKEGEDPLAALRESVKSFLTKPATPAPEAQPQQPTTQPQATPAEPQPKGGEKAQYNWDLPTEVVEALGSDEPAQRRKALNGIVNGLANKLAEDFGKAMAVGIQEAERRATERVLQHLNAERQVQTVREDFYNTHQDLKALADRLPAFDKLIWETANQLAAQTGKKGWDPELREAVAATVKLQLGLVQAPAATTPQGNGNRQPRSPSFSAGGGGGPSSRPNGADGGNEFSDVLRTF
jgi:hypothetical protein